MKWVKQRNVTINRKRVEEAALLEGADPMEQGLYAAYQTEMYVPPPVVNVSCFSSWGVSGADEVRRTGQDSEERLWEYRPVCAVDAAFRSCSSASYVLFFPGPA